MDGEFWKHNFDKLILLAVLLICSGMLGVFGYFAMKAAAPNQTAAQIVTGLLAAFSGTVGSISTLVTSNLMARKNPPDKPGELPPDSPQ